MIARSVRHGVAERAGVLLLVVVVATLLGLLARWRDRRVERRGFERPGEADAPLDVPVGASGAVVVLGTTACAACARTLALVRRQAERTDGAVVVSHLLVDDVPRLVDQLGVRTAPTVILLDPSRTVVGRHDGGLDPAGAERAVASLACHTAPGDRSDPPTDAHSGDGR